MTDLHKTIEPVAWTVVGDGKFGEYKIGDEFTKLGAEYWNSRGYELVPLYTAQPNIDALIAEAVAKEREACAKVCEETTAAWTEHLYNDACVDCAEAIRARGQK